MSTPGRLPISLGSITLMLVAALTCSACVSLRQVTSESKSPISIRWIAPTDVSPLQPPETAAPPQATGAAADIEQIPQSKALPYTVRPGVLLHTPRMWHLSLIHI